MNLISTKQIEKIKEHWTYIDKVLLSLLVFIICLAMTFVAQAQDTTPPTITSLSPANLSNHIDPDVGALTMQLSETVVVGDLAESYDQFELRVLYSNPVVQAFEVDDPTQVTISGSTITLKNVATLQYGTSYYISMSRSGIVEDLSGNPLAAITNNGIWRFTTQKSDLVVTSTFPSNGAQFVEPDATTDFTITFNQQVFSGGGLKYAYLREVDGSSVQSWTLTSTNDVTLDGNTVTLHRSFHTMDPGKEYYIYTSADAFRDAESRYFEGINNNETDFWHFSTKTETTPPQISSLDPAHGEEGVDPSKSVFTIKFDETVSIDRAGYIELYLKTKSGATLVDQTDPNDIVYNKGNYQIPFDGHGGLIAGGLYYVSIADNIFHDSQENYFDGTNVENWSFLANRNPTSISLSNSSVDENQSAGTVVGTISAIDPDEGDNATVTLVSGTGSTHNASFQIVGNQLQTAVELDYEAGTTRSIRVRATDNVGGSREQVLTINVSDVDDTPPNILAIDPSDGSTGVDLSPSITFTFDEDVQLAPSGVATFHLRRSSNGQSAFTWQSVDGVADYITVSGNQMIFEVPNSLSHSTEYYFSGQSISDLNGNTGNPFGNNSFTTRALSYETQVLAASIPGVVGDPVIDNENNTITATVQATSPSRIDIDLDLSLGATFSFSSNPQYYQNGVPFPMTVRAEANNFESWTITLNWEELQGSYNVGDNGTFTTISDAIGQLWLAGMSGDVVFEIEEGYNVTKTVFLANPEPDHNVTIRPQADATQIDLYPESNYGSVFRVNNVISNMIIDGADPSSGNIVMNINANIEDIEGVMFFGSGAYDFTLQNLRFNITDGTGVSTNSNTVEISGIDVIGCEFVAVNTEASQNVRGIWMQRSNLSDINIIGNKFYNLPNSPDPNLFMAIGASDDLTDVINNSIAIRGNSTSGIIRAINVLHNSIHLYGTGAETNSYHYAIGYGTNIQNNNVSIERTSGTGTTRRFVHYSNMQAEDAGNNVHILEDGVSVTRYALNAADLTEMSSIAATTTFVDAEFTDASVADLSLSGGSYSDSDLRTSPVDGVDTDILGNSRSASWPSKGAYEVPNRASDFLTFSIPQQVSAPTINTDNHTVVVAVNGGTALTNLVPTFTISPGASIDKASGDEQDFTNPVSYFITDEQEYAQQEWVVTVSEQNLAPTDIALAPSSIDENEVAGTIVGELSGTDPNGDELVFSIVGGENSQHGYLFEIDAETNELKSKAPFDFEQNEELYIRIEADDQAGETYEEALVISVIDVDEVAPAVSSTSPEAEDRDVALNANLTITYDEPIQEGSGTYLLKTLDGQLVESLDVSGGQVSVSGSTVTINPTNNLLYNQSYYVEAFAGVVEDMLGNPAPAIAEQTWYFNTETIISSFSPADEATDVSPFADLVITFDEPVALQTGGVFRMFRKADDVQVGVDWSFNGATADGSTVTFDIPENLEPDVEIYINILGGIEDAGGNPIDIAGKDTWNFTPVIQSQTVTLNPIAEKTYGSGPFAFTPATSTSGQAIDYTSSEESVATVSGSVITIHGAGTTTIRATQPGNTYYEPAFVEQEFTVNKAPQSITFLGPANMTYGDANHVLNGSIEPSDNDVAYEIISGDAVLIDQEELELVIVGTGDVTIRATGEETDNYLAPNHVDRSFSVYKKTITAIANDDTKVYGEDNPTFSISYEGLAYEETKDVIDTEPTANSVAVSNSGVGNYDITLSGGTDDNYAFEFNSGNLEITKKILTASADDQSREYGESNPGFTLSFDGFIDGDNATDLVGTLPSRITSADEDSHTGEYAIEVSGGSDQNYEFQYEDGILTITKAELEVFAYGGVKNYGDDNPEFDMEIEGFKNGETSSVLTSIPVISTVATKYSPAGTYDVIASGGVSDNYTFDYDNATLTINKVDLSAEVQDAERIYGEANPDFEIVYDGFVEGENANDLDSPLEAMTEADENSNVGTYNITLPETVDTNYNISTSSGTLTITKAEQIVIIEEITDKVKNAPSFDVMASVNSGAELNYSVSGPATNEGSMITLTGALGVVTVTVSVEESMNYTADSEQVLFEVNDKQAQSISFSIEDQTYGNSVELNGESSSDLEVSYVALSGPITLSGNTLILTGAGEASITAVQSGDEVYNEAEPETVNFIISPAALTATAHDQSMIYGEELPTLTFEYDGFVNEEDESDLNEEPTISTVDAASDAGTYEIALEGGDADNYSITLVNATLTIQKTTATLAVTAIADKSTVDDPFSVEAEIDSDQDLSYSVTGPATVSEAGLITLDGNEGDVEVTVLAVANTNYEEASTSVSFSVIDNSLKTQTITITAIEDKLTTDEAFEVTASSTSELEVALTVTGPASIDGTTITLDGT
ncbi:MBG domain-containing protein, partial [Reichenbachiella sp.]